MTNQTYSINLFRGKQKSFFDKFMQWALSFGRFVVIVTETIALVAFLYRFTLDRQLVDLHDKIKNKQQLVGFLKKPEDTFRSIQSSLASIAALTKTGQESVTLFNDMSNLGSPDVLFNTITLSENAIQLDATVQSVASLTNFINKLKAYPKIATVSLDRIENKTASATIGVGITATIKK